MEAGDYHTDRPLWAESDDIKRPIADGYILVNITVRVLPYRLL